MQRLSWWLVCVLAAWTAHLLEAQERLNRGTPLPRVYGPQPPIRDGVQSNHGVWINTGILHLSGGYIIPWGVTAPWFVAPTVPAFSFHDPWLSSRLVIYGIPDAVWSIESMTQPLVVLPPAAVVSQPLVEAWQDNLERWGTDLPPAKPNPISLPVPPSSPEAKLRSLQAQLQGDEHLRHQQWLSAYVDYKRAVQAAGDNAQAHFRLGLTLTIIQHYETAVRSLKRSLALDPSLPRTGPSLETLLGADSHIARNTTLQNLMEYVRQDVRDPDRLFLWGVWLHYDQDERAREVFETGYRLAGGGQHFLAFLKPQQPDRQPPENAPAAAPQLDQLPALPPPPPPDR